MAPRRHSKQRRVIILIIMPHMANMLYRRTADLWHGLFLKSPKKEGFVELISDIIFSDNLNVILSDIFICTKNVRSPDIFT